MKAVARRSFLRFMSAAPLAVMPLAKSATAALAGEAALTGASVIGYGQNAQTVHGPNALNIWRTLAKEGLPHFKLVQLRRDARAQRLIDPDIAAMQSWSLQTKIKAQEARTFERLKYETIDSYRLESLREPFLKRLGLGWL